MTTHWLIDKSALARLPQSSQSEEWTNRVQRGLVSVSTVTILEVGYSALSSSDWNNRIEKPPLTLMPLVNITPGIEKRAIDVQGVLAQRGHHRAPSVADLLIAATAELQGLTVLHCDKDFDLISEITGQNLHRIEGF